MSNMYFNVSKSEEPLILIFTISKAQENKVLMYKQNQKIKTIEAFKSKKENGKKVMSFLDKDEPFLVSMGNDGFATYSTHNINTEGYLHSKQYTGYCRIDGQ